MRRLANLGQEAAPVDAVVRGSLAMSPRPLAAIPTAAGVTRLALAPNGHLVATGDATGKIELYDGTTGAERWRAEHVGRITGLSWSADGRSVVSASIDGTARIWDAATGRGLLDVGHGRPVLAAALSADARRLLTGSLDGTARMWDVASGRELGRVFDEPGVKAIAWSADGRWLGLSGTDETVRLVEASSGRPTGTIARTSSPLGAVALSSDGRRLATRTGDTTQLLEIPAQRLIARMQEELATPESARAHPNDAPWGDDAIAFSPDGRRLATAHRDHTARVYDAASGGELMRIGHRDRDRKSTV